MPVLLVLVGVLAVVDGAELEEAQAVAAGAADAGGAALDGSGRGRGDGRGLLLDLEWVGGGGGGGEREEDGVVDGRRHFDDGVWCLVVVVWIKDGVGWRKQVNCFFLFETDGRD